MISIDKLRVIAKAKFSDKTKLGDWYKERLALCKVCPYNSANKETLTLKEASMVTLNLGKPTCLGCGCECAAKASVRAEVCGLKKLNLKPIWEALPDIEKYDISNLIFSNLNSDKVKVIPGATTRLVYGNLKYNADTEITLSIEGKSSKVSDVKVAVSCGCTSAVTKEVAGKFFITLKYDSTRLGDFRKTVSISFTKDFINRSLSFRLEGNIIK